MSACHRSLELRLKKLRLRPTAQSGSTSSADSQFSPRANDCRNDLIPQSAAAMINLGVLRGLEKENLRIAKDHLLSSQLHPQAFGSALTNTHITTDFSESLLEMITSPQPSIHDLLTELLNLQQFVHKGIDEETLWASSMPPLIVDPLSIQIAEYGCSSIAKMKRIYREGLALRYGKLMQVIAGLHFNFSFADDFLQQMLVLGGEKDSVSDLYMAQVRQILRDVWILPYLFGASPALSRSSVQGEIPSYLQAHADHTLISPYATSLRMSDLGYRNKGEELFSVDYSNVQAYAESLAKVVNTPYPEYTQLASAKTSYRQLNDSILQIENEFYSPVRPKQIIEAGESPTKALCRRGVAYVELRALDLDPFEPLGMSMSCLQFLDVFMFSCLLTPNPQHSPFKKGELHECQHHLNQVVTYGRDPNLMMSHDGKAVSFQQMTDELFLRLETVAGWMDSETSAQTNYLQVVKEQKEKCEDVTLTPSARIIKALQDQDVEYDVWVQQLSNQHRQRLLTCPVDAEYQKKLREEAIESQRQFQLLEDSCNQ